MLGLKAIETIQPKRDLKHLIYALLMCADTWGWTHIWFGRGVRREPRNRHPLLEVILAEKDPFLFLGILLKFHTDFFFLVEIFECSLYEHEKITPQ